MKPPSDYWGRFYYFCGKSGIQPSEALKLCPLEFHQYINGSMSNHIGLDRTIWETSRYTWFYTASPYWDEKKGGKLTLTKIYPFPWDKKVKKQSITVEEFKLLSKKWEKNSNLHSKMK